ncbi:MAG: hypothetical protein ABF449_14550 [Ethanoligenens sp.]
MDIDEYEKLKAALELLSQLAKGERSGKEKGWMSMEQVEAFLEREIG